ncbi:hypothetical protein TNCV_4271801 [Trichonephila clavipes]|nr:hypothetical protein TNCV_4271801 [Trichonephila clavipes]
MAEDFLTNGRASFYLALGSKTGREEMQSEAGEDRRSTTDCYLLEHILKGRERFEIGMTSNILSPVEKMSSEHLATTRQKLEYLFSIKDQLDKMFEEKAKAYKEIEKVSTSNIFGLT